MQFINFIITCFTLIPILVLLVGRATGQDECTSSTLACYDCDSRYHQNCDDPFNKTMSSEDEPPTKECKGCCVKIIHKFANESWVERTCTENILMEFPVFHVCMIEGKGHGFMCFCEKDLCNRGLEGAVANYVHLILTLTVGYVIN